MPPSILGITVDQADPLKFNFLIDQGDQKVPADEQEEQFKRLIKYFLASLTIPEKELWVNLSPYENQRIIPSAFGQTEMGRDLLAQDYVLKQMTASLIYPEDNLGKKFWADVYKKAQEQFGTTNIPVNTFNKVWIVPDEAMVYEHDGTALLVKSHLKVMLEEDYLSLEKNSVPSPSVGRVREGGDKAANTIGSQVVREIVLPALEKEVNEGKNFALLRQINDALVLATWYKRALKEGLLAKFYVDRNKVGGLEVFPSLGGRGEGRGTDVDKIYQRYLQAFKKGVYNYIKEDFDPYTQQTIPRKYFSGGYTTQGPDGAMLSQRLKRVGPKDVPAEFRRRVGSAMASGRVMEVNAKAEDSVDAAMLSNGRFRILVVENDVSFAGLYGSFLTRAGYQYEIATSAEQALEMIRKNPPHYSFILSDYNMPGINGVEFATALQHVDPGIKMIINTGGDVGVVNAQAQKRGLLDSVVIAIHSKSRFNRSDVFFKVLDGYQRDHFRSLNIKEQGPTGGQDKAMGAEGNVVLSDVAFKGIREFRSKIEKDLGKISETQVKIESLPKETSEMLMLLSKEVPASYEAFFATPENQNDSLLRSIGYIILDGGIKIKDPVSGKIGFLGLLADGTIGPTDDYGLAAAWDIPNAFFTLGLSADMLARGKVDFLPIVRAEIKKAIQRIQNVIALLDKIEGHALNAEFKAMQYRKTKGEFIWILDPRLTVVNSAMAKAMKNNFLVQGEPWEVPNTPELRAFAESMEDQIKGIIQEVQRIDALNSDQAWKENVGGLSGLIRELLVNLKSNQDDMLVKRAQKTLDMGFYRTDSSIETLWDLSNRIHPTAGALDFISGPGKLQEEDKQTVLDFKKKVRGVLSFLSGIKNAENVKLIMRSEDNKGTVFSEAIDPRPFNFEDDSDQALAADVGGIDLNPANLNLHIKRDGKGIPLPAGQQDMLHLNSIEGLMPVIIKITPVTYIPALSSLIGEERSAITN